MMTKTNYIQNTIKCPKKELQLKPTLSGGQCFRWKQVEDGLEKRWRGVFGHRVWTLSQSDDVLKYTVHLPDGTISERLENGVLQMNSIPTVVEDCVYYENMLVNYLRLEENLQELYADWSSKDNHFEESAKDFFGIRVLRQDPVENIFSFICSTNNNIVRITSMVEKLCLFYGMKIGEIDNTTYYDFPTVSTLAKDGVEAKLRKEGFGYRAKYLHQSAVKILEYGGESWLKKLQQLPYLEAKQQLISLPGIGAKVADCICLMSLGHLEAIPVDTHVFQISQRYLPHLKSCKTVTDKVYNEIVDYFQKLYGKYAGWAHSVLFCADLRQFQTTSKGTSNKSVVAVKRKFKHN